MLKIIETWLKGAKGIWQDELPSVLWAYRTIARTPIDETPFCLTFWSEAVIPAEIGLTTYNIAHHDERRNEEGMRLQLDLLDEVRATVEQQTACYQDLISKLYNTKVRL